MTHCEQRLTRLEEALRLRHGNGHFISIARHPWPLRDEQLDAWFAAQWRCECTPDCPGKRIGLLVPEKAPSPEAWADEVQRYYRERVAGAHEP